MFHEFYCLAGMDHCTEHLPFLTDNSLTKISLVNIRLWIIHVAILEKNCFCPCFHQILIGKKTNALRIRKHDLILRTCNGNCVSSRHIIEFSLYTSASAAGKCLAGNFLTVCVQMRVFYLSHRHAKFLNFCCNTQTFTLFF